LTFASLIKSNHLLRSMTNQFQVEIERCGDLWFDDSTLVIRVHERAEGSDPVKRIMEFRVYRGLLERQSDGILAEKPPEVETEMVERCPVLPLYDDSIDSMVNFLKMVYFSE